MGLFDSFIDKRVVTVLANRQANQFSGINSNQLFNFINGSLPTINPDGYDYYDPYSTIGAVYEAITLIAGKVQQCPILFYRVKDKRKAEKAEQLIKSGRLAEGMVLKAQALEEVDAPTALRDLLLRPNPYQDGKQFINTLAQCFLLRGNAYLYANRVGTRPKELFIFPEMEILTKMGEYYDPVMGYRVNAVTELKDFDRDDIYHFKTANPSQVDQTYQYLYGVSPLRAYLEDLRTLKEGGKLKSTTMKTGGVYGSVAPKNKEDQFSKEQRSDFKDMLVKAKGSREELSRLFASSIALEYTQFGLPPSDLQLLEVLKLSNEQIYKAYKLPVGYVSTDGNTLNNRSEYKKEVVFNGVAPWCEAIDTGLTEFVAKPYDSSLVCKLDYTQLPELSGVMAEMSDYLRPLVEAGVLSPNEARAMMGYGEVSGQDMNAFYYKGRKLGTITDNNDNNNNANQ